MPTASKEDATSSVARARACELLHGVVGFDELPDGWVRPQRLTVTQRRALTSCMAWYPGIFRQMATCTAGVTLEFETDSSCVTIGVRVDVEPPATRNVLAGVDVDRKGQPVERRPHDGISVDVDGRHRDPVMPARGVDVFEISLDAEGDSGETMTLPGMGPVHHVRVWLPCLRGCELGDVMGDGSFVRPVETRPVLLVLGDSGAQGFVADDPALAWPSVLAGALDMDLVNQGVGAQVFQPSMLQGVGTVPEPERVVVALGANYRYGKANPAVVRREIMDFLQRAVAFWPEAPMWVVTPLWHDERRQPAVAGSCVAEVPAMVAEAVERVAASREAEVRLVDGRELMDASRKLVCDADGHPTAKGMAQVAERLRKLMAGEDASGADSEVDAAAESECACLRDFGQFGRCGACVRHEATAEPEPDDCADATPTDAAGPLLIELDFGDDGDDEPVAPVVSKREPKPARGSKGKRRRTS